ncbi:hypothetical protein D3C74_116880 [compost metagenome]
MMRRSNICWPPWESSCSWFSELNPPEMRVSMKRRQASQPTNTAIKATPRAIGIGTSRVPKTIPSTNIASSGSKVQYGERKCQAAKPASSAVSSAERKATINTPP